MTQFAAMGCRVLYIARISSRRWLRMAPAERQLLIAENGSRAINLPFTPFSGKLRAANEHSLRRAAAAGKKFLDQCPPARIIWLQHPDYAAVARRLPRELLVYDAMDPHGAFSGAPRWVADREQELMRTADVVFTGGRSLHRQRATLNPNVHCFPSGIDFDHFASATRAGTVPEDLQRIKKPVLGYFGAVDERVDWELVSQLCHARPEWSIVFLGPLIGKSAPPLAAPNFHWLGARDYDLLPAYLRGFDAALIPWHVNELTRNMSPTKTPEYLAAGRPVVSTEIPDVVSDYGQEVLIAKSAEEFILQCDEALRRPIGDPRKPPQARTWQETAIEMMTIINEKLAIS